MTSERVLISLAAIAVLGVGSQWVAWRLRLPSILILLTVGLLAGPVTGLLDPSAMFGELLFPMVSLAVAVILFEGGLTLDLKELSQIGGTLLRLVTVGVAVTWLLAAFFAHFLAGLPWGIALLFGAILTVTGPTVIGPLLRHVRPKGDVGAVANWEGIVADVIGAILSVLVLHALLEGASAEGSAVIATLVGLVATVAVGILTGALGAVALAVPLRRHWIPDALQSPAALGVVLGAFALADHWQPESGLLAVTLIGVVLRNQERTPVKHIIEFKENLRTLLISSLFIVLAARVDLDALGDIGFGEIAFVAALIFVVRPAAVLLSTAGTDMPRPERLFLAFLAPRGIVAAAVSALAGEQLVRLAAPELFGAERIAPLAFLVIIATVAIYGLAAAPLARRLGLAEQDPQGVMIVGCGRFAVQVARAFRSISIASVLVDTNRTSVADARLEGLTAVYGSALAEDAAERLPLGGIGRLLALTPNDEVNALAALHYIELFGRAECYQLVPGGAAAKAPTPNQLRGRSLFGAEATYAALEERVANGHSIKATPLTEAFDAEAWRTHHGPSALPLFRVTREGRVTVFTTDAPPALEPGHVLLGLVPPEDEDTTPEPGEAGDASGAEDGAVDGGENGEKNAE